MKDDSPEQSLIMITGGGFNGIEVNPDYEDKDSPDQRLILTTGSRTHLNRG
jgi:hypothetical protein